MSSTPRPLSVTIKKYAAIVLLVLAVIVIIQNAEATTVRFLLWDFAMSKALLLPLMLGIGFLTGWLVGGWRGR